MSKMQILKSVLLQAVNDIDAGNSNASDEELEEIIKDVNKIINTRNKLSKYQACKYLNVSRDGKLPEGKKEQGFKEKFWYLSDLQQFKNK